MQYEVKNPALPTPQVSPRRSLCSTTPWPKFIVCWVHPPRDTHTHKKTGNKDGGALQQQQDIPRFCHTPCHPVPSTNYARNANCFCNSHLHCLLFVCLSAVSTGQQPVNNPCQIPDKHGVWAPLLGGWFMCCAGIRTSWHVSDRFHAFGRQAHARGWSTLGVGGVRGSQSQWGIGKGGRRQQARQGGLEEGGTNEGGGVRTDHMCPACAE